MLVGGVVLTDVVWSIACWFLLLCYGVFLSCGCFCFVVVLLGFAI